MNEASQKLQQETSPDTINATSSPESEAGLTLSDSQECQTTTHSGPEAALANPSALPPETEKELTTLAISGPYGKSSSASATLQSFLGSRLKMLLGTVGSTLYRLTWKNKVTPLGRPYLALVASALHTGVNGCTGWPTPNASQHNYYENPDGWLARQEQRARDGKSKFAVNLGVAAKFASGTTPSGSPVGTDAKDHVNPDLARWLMGFPTGWTSYAPTATRSSPKSRRRS